MKKMIAKKIEGKLRVKGEVEMTYCNADCNLKDACKRHVNKSQFEKYVCEDLSNDTEFCMIAKAKSKMGIKDYNTRKM